MADSATRFTTVGIASGTFTAGVLSAAAVGSLLLGGNLITDRALNTSARAVYGTGAYQVYKDVICTNTGGLTKYNSCLLQNPLTGTGVIHRVQLDSNKAPTASPATCMITPDGTGTGATAFGHVLFKNRATASGRSLIATPMISQVSSGAVLIPPNWYFRCYHGTTPGPGLKEQFRVWMAEQYIP